MFDDEQRETLTRFALEYGWEPPVVCKVFNFLYSASIEPHDLPPEFTVGESQDRLIS